LIPKLQSFKPDILLISAGFDAHYDDFYHFLTEQDYHWITEKLCSVAEAHGGKVVSILEGGYSLSSPVPKPTKGSKASTSTAVGVAAGLVVSSPTDNTDVASPLAENSTAGALPSRQGRGKNKKYEASDSLLSLNGKAAIAHSQAVASFTKSTAGMHTAYAQLPGDGGLVKGVLAHVAALSGLEAW
jgi:hypothetical protein